MVAQLAAGFDYSLLPAGERSRLKDSVGKVRTLQRSAATSIVLIGGVLRDARERLPHGRFLEWVASEFGWHRSSAYRFVAVFEAFGGAHTSQFEKFDAGAMYELSLPGVPQSAREYAMELAGDGKRVTLADAKEILDAYRPAAVPKADVPTLAPFRPADRHNAPPPPPPPDSSPAALAFEAVLSLLAGGAMLHLTSHDDGDADGATVEGRYYPAAGGERPRYSVRRTLAEVVAELAGREPEKVCLKCGLARPLSAYARDANRADGHVAYCKACERARSKAGKRRRKSPPAGGAMPGPG